MTAMPTDGTAIISFLQSVFQDTNKKNAVIAVSGGIDSAVCLSLLARAISKENIFPLLLPYGSQSVEDSKTILEWNAIPEANWKIVDVQPLVDALAQTLSVDASSDHSRLRRANIMARMRMICVFDRAKGLDALVCGTENKSEHYLGYFTRFGDSASDIEPICHLYKTQVRELAMELKLPDVFLTKAPSAGLWENQTDEAEMGFSYEDADKALAVLLGESTGVIDQELFQKVKAVVDAQAFKLQVPYIYT